MIRQRVNLRTPSLAYLVRALTAVVGLAVLLYGLMVVLLAVKVSPRTVNSISAYRTLYHHAAGLHATDFTTVVRLVAGFAGLLVFFACVHLALQEVPRPYLAREPFTVGEHHRGATEVAPRALERVAEIAAAAHHQVTAARGRLGDQELDIEIRLRTARSVADALRDVQARVRDALEVHGLPTFPVNVTLTGYDRSTKRELA
jgi:hypothetical protein